jgi:hypothetical protein
MRSVYSSEEIAKYRSDAALIFAQSELDKQVDSKTIRTNVLFRFPQLREVFRNGKLMAGIESVLGKDCLLLPESGLHDSGLFGGWHRDTGSSENAGRKYHFEKDFHLVNVAIYLQDNNEDYAGGLDIVPGSQHTRRSWWEKQKSANRRVKFVLSHLDRRGLLPKSVLHVKKGAHTIRSAVGDAVLFHFQCEHRPTHPKVVPVPDSHRKLAIFLTFSKNNKFAHEYVDYFCGASPYWKTFRYTDEYKKEMQGLGIRLVNLHL